MHPQYLHRHLWSNNATAEALRIVREIISSHPKPLTAQEVYKLALEVPSTVTGKNPIKHIESGGAPIELEGPLPPHPEHPIRSMRCVLPTDVFRG